MIPFLAIAILLTPWAVFAQQSGYQNGRKEAHATRVPAGAIAVDGRLSEPVWTETPAIDDFVQREPNEGAPPSDRIEVRFAFDDDALYVGARMDATGPIQAPLGWRDSSRRAEHIYVSLDTHLDRRTATSFGVTATGVRLDQYYLSDDQRDFDESFAPVWQARTSIDANGWVAELRIPFSQLRFSEHDTQVWGLNVQRWVPSRNEDVFWAPVPRTERRWPSLFGTLHGIEGIQTGRRVELLPYLASASRIVGTHDPEDPFSASQLGGRVGMDIKAGLGSNLTLDATFNPDFGQVDADPAEVNLSAFETVFPERRPFFVEGGDLIRGPVGNYFNSRRIGATPDLDLDGDFVDYPRTSTILGAAKVTGRLDSGLSIGMLGAVTGEEFARTFTRSEGMLRLPVAPLTQYGLARLQQEFGGSGSTVSVMGTIVHRDLADSDFLSSLLARNAMSFSGDSLLRMRGGDYQLHLHAGMTHVAGEAAAIDHVQRSSVRYVQRPDADYLTYDPFRTSMTGSKTFARLERRNARHWLWEGQIEAESPGFEPNDIGRVVLTDGRSLVGRLAYRETAPGRWWRNYSAGVFTRHVWNYGGERQLGRINPTFAVLWPNFWGTEVGGDFNLRLQDHRLTRGGPLMEQPASWKVMLDVRSNSSARTRGDGSLGYGRDEAGGLNFWIGGMVNVISRSQWEFSIRPRYERLVDTQQYLTTLPGGGAATYGSRYVFGYVDRSTYSTQVRGNYTFKPDLTLDFYGEPFAASGRHDHIGELVAAQTRLRRRYGGDGTTLSLVGDTYQVTDGGTSFTLEDEDFNILSFRSNLVLRWEWRRGSTLYLVWQQDRSSDVITPNRVSVADMFSSVGRAGDNYFAIKTSFWIGR